MKKFTLAALLALLLLAGCRAEEPKVLVDDRWPVTVEKLVIEAAPRRVISLSPATTDAMLDLGYGGRLVGADDFCTLPADYLGLARCGSTLRPDLSALRSLEPDLVVCSAAIPAQAAETLAELGAKLLILPRADSLNGILANYKSIATAMQGQEQGDLVFRQMIQFTEVTLNYVEKAAGRGLDPGASAIYLRQLPFVIATGDTLEGKWLSKIGLINQGGPFTGWDYPLEAEPDLNPDYIFCDRSIETADLEASDYYRRTSAVTAGRIYPFDAAAFERQAPRMFLEWERMLREAFPSGFSTMEKPSIVLPMTPRPRPAPVEKAWWETLLGG